MVGKAIFSRLTTDTAVRAIVSSRVYPHTTPVSVKTYPLIVYQPGDIEREYTADGVLNVAYQMVDIACIATSYAAVEALSVAVLKALEAQHGTWGGVVIQLVTLDADNESIEIHPIEDRYWVAQLSFRFVFEIA